MRITDARHVPARSYGSDRMTIKALNTSSVDAANAAKAHRNRQYPDEPRVGMADVITFVERGTIVKVFAS